MGHDEDKARGLEPMSHKTNSHTAVTMPWSPSSAVSPKQSNKRRKAQKLRIWLGRTRRRGPSGAVGAGSRRSASAGASPAFPARAPPRLPPSFLGGPAALKIYKPSAVPPAPNKKHLNKQPPRHNEFIDSAGVIVLNDSVRLSVG